MREELQDTQQPYTLRTAWKIVRWCSLGEIPPAETARRASDYLRRHAGLDEHSPSVRVLDQASLGLLTEDRLREKAAAEVDRLLSLAKAQLLKSVH